MFNTITTTVIYLSFAFTLAQATQYGVRMRWTSNAQSCTNPPDAIEYWPIGSPFAEQGSGTCVDIPLADGGHAYYTFSTSDTIPSTPTSWSPFYAVNTLYEDSSACVSAQGAASVVITNSDSCIFMGASSTGYHYQRLDCTSETSGQVLTCKDSACTDCRAPFQYQGGCDAFVNSVHSCTANSAHAATAALTPAPTSTPTPIYGVRMRWTSNAHKCQNQPDSIDYWPLNSPFAESGTGSCVSGTGGNYYTYTTSTTIPQVPKKWSRFYAVETFYDDETMCNAADPSTVELVSMTNSDSCIHMGPSTTGFSWMKLSCTSETAGQVLQCSDSKCKNCRTPFQYQGGCSNFINSVHSCSSH